jgi:hypothetical protein
MRRMAANAAKDATAESSPPPSREATKPDLLTIAAIAIVAAVIADFIHEGLGHGGVCVATGGQPLVLSTVHFECSADTRLVAAGGTLANLIFGTLSWGAVRAVKQSAPWRYFFWLLMTFNLFDAGGYFLFSGIGNIGDWAAVVAGWQPAWAWRVGLAALGIITYFFLFVPLSLRELRPFLGKDAKIRVRRARQLTLVPYLTAGVLSCVAGALNPVGPLLILISAAAASFGGHSGLTWMWNLFHNPRIPSSEFQMPEIESSRGWIISAVVLAIGFIAGLGPGVKLHSVQRVMALDSGFHRNAEPAIPEADHSPTMLNTKVVFFLGVVPKNALVVTDSISLALFAKSERLLIVPTSAVTALIRTWELLPACP